MADSTISALNAAAALDGTETLPIAQATSTVRTTTQAVADLALSAINVVSNTVSNLISLHDVLSNRVSANSGTGGGGSVTSAEVQTASAAATSADAHANAASAAATSVDARLNAVSDIVSQHTVSLAQISNRLSGVTVRTSVGGATSIKGLQSAFNTLSTQVSNEASIRAVSVNTASAAATSVLNYVSAASAQTTGAASVHGIQSIVNALSARISVISNAASDALSHAAAASAAATSVLNYVCATSALNNAGTSVKGVQSIANALSNRISIVSNAASDALSHAAAASAAATSVLNYICAVSVKNTAAASVKGLQSMFNAFSNRISAAAGGGLNSTQVSDMIGSVNGANYSCRAFSALGTATTSVKGLQSVINRISNTFSNAFSAGSAISTRSIDAPGSATASVKGLQSVINQISATVSALHGQTRIITTTIAASVAGTLTDINGTTVSVVAGSYYEYRAKLQVAMSAANALGIGLTFPGMQNGGAAGIMMGIGSVGASAWQSTIGNVQIMAFDDDGSGSIILSLVKGVVSVSPVHIDATFAVSTSGNIVLQYRASVSTSNVKINPGSHVRLFRLA